MFRDYGIYEEQRIHQLRIIQLLEYNAELTRRLIQATNAELELPDLPPPMDYQHFDEPHVEWTSPPFWRRRKKVKAGR